MDKRDGVDYELRDTTLSRSVPSSEILLSMNFRVEYWALVRIDEKLHRILIEVEWNF